MPRGLPSSLSSTHTPARPTTGPVLSMMTTLPGSMPASRATSWAASEQQVHEDGGAAGVEVAGAPERLADVLLVGPDVEDPGAQDLAGGCRPHGPRTIVSRVSSGALNCSTPLASNGLQLVDDLGAEHPATHLHHRSMNAAQSLCTWP